MSTTPRLQPRLCGVHHVKLPVTDVQASRDWYCRVLGFQPELDFVEDGTLMGVGLSHPGGLRLALRCDRDRIAALVGFDPVALAVPGRAELDARRSRTARRLSESASATGWRGCYVA
jgi:catechol 2,3-dioxygenase-like lactoylglutathione lyase family enzyme